MYSTLVATAALVTAGLAAPAIPAATTHTVKIGTADGYYHLVAACHAGAGVEALCLYPNTSSEFTYQPLAAGIGQPGYLQLNASENAYQLQKLSFLVEATSEDGDIVQPAYFGGSNNPPIELAVNPEGYLGVYVDNEIQDNWYLCPWTNLGYSYATVSWVQHNAAPPQENDCQKITVQLA